MSARAAIVASLVALIALAAACSRTAAIPAEDLAIRIEATTDQVVLGRAFPLQVVRIWSKDYAPEPFREDALAPLVLKLVQDSRRESPDRVEETLQFRAYAFTLEEMTTTAPTIAARPRSGGPRRTASAAPLKLRALPSLRADDARDPELPQGLFARPRPGALLLAAAALAVACVAVVFLAIHRRRKPATLVRIAPSAAERLRRLRNEAAKSPEEIDALHVELSLLVRDHLALRHGLSAPTMTPEEIAQASDGARHEAAVDLLLRCDLTKFGRRLPEEQERLRRLDDAEKLVADVGEVPSP